MGDKCRTCGHDSAIVVWRRDDPPKGDHAAWQEAANRVVNVARRFVAAGGSTRDLVDAVRTLEHEEAKVLRGR